MKTVGAYEAKTNLSKLLNEVQQGERITITRHGTPVAVLVPVNAFIGISVDEAGKRFKSLTKPHRPGDPSIKEMIEDGRRF